MLARGFRPPDKLQFICIFPAAERDLAVYTKPIRNKQPKAANNNLSIAKIMHFKRDVEGAVPYKIYL